MELNSPKTRTETRTYVEARFARGPVDIMVAAPGDTLTIDALRIKVEGNGRTVEWDRGGEGVIGYRKWTAMVDVLIDSPKGDR